jgi:beta-mannanase
MVNILFDCPNADDFKEELSPYFSENSRVTVVALSFYDDYVFDEKSWEKVYGKNVGEGYFEVAIALKEFGVDEKNVKYINYFTDSRESATEKIKWANTLYFTGGLPDRMMERIEEMGILDALKKFDGVVFGYSAGAVIQLREYHLYPDGDYKDYGYYEGLSYVDSLLLEVHYEYKSEQDESVRRVLSERTLPVYVTHTMGGGVVVDGDNITVIGRVDLYENK